MKGKGRMFAVTDGVGASWCTGQLEESGRLYQEALAMAQATGDSEAVQQIQEGLKELETNKKKKNGREDSA